jgi:hypothetical protein
MNGLSSHLLVLALAVAATSAHAQGDKTPSTRLGTDSLAMRFTGMEEGSHTLQLSRSDTGYVYTERVSVPPMFVRNVRIDLGPGMEVRRVTSEVFPRARMRVLVTCALDFPRLRCVGCKRDSA